MINIGIKYQNGNTTKIDFDPSKTVLELKKEIPKHLKDVNFQGRYIRLLFQGTFLEDSQKLSIYKIENDDVLIWYYNFSFLIFSILSDRPQIETKRTVIEEVEIKGFDRLREAGFTEEEVSHFRRDFYSSRPEIRAQILAGTLTEEEVQQYEEQWLNEESRAQSSDTNEENEAVSLEGNNFHFALGMILGFILGFISLVWMIDKSFQRKLKLGVLIGLGLNLSFTFVKLSMPVFKYL